MLDLDVQVERTLTTVDFLAVLVGTDILSIDLFSSPPVMFLAIAIFSLVIFIIIKFLVVVVVVLIIYNL